MDTQRLILFFVFSFSLLLLWDSWQKEHRPPTPTIAQQGTVQATVPSPSVPAQATPAAQQKPGDVIPPNAAALAKHETVRVKTDNLIADIDLQGRSEEHTSELQSLRHLVCRLLL